MRFEVGDGPIVETPHRCHGADLVDQPHLEFRVRKGHRTLPEPAQIRLARMRPDAYPGPARPQDRIAHHRRVSPMQPASHIGRPDDAKQCLVIANCETALAFAEVCFDVQAHGSGSSLSK